MLVYGYSLRKSPSFATDGSRIAHRLRANGETAYRHLRAARGCRDPIAAVPEHDLEISRPTFDTVDERGSCWRNLERSRSRTLIDHMAGGIESNPRHASTDVARRTERHRRTILDLHGRHVNHRGEDKMQKDHRQMSQGRSFPV